MTYITFRELRQAIQDETDTQDEKIVDFSELVAFTNQAITAAESLIFTLNEDYFLSDAYLTLHIGQNQYDMPSDIYANKIRGIQYKNSGSRKYEVKRVRNLNKFDKIMYIEDLGSDEDYRYIIHNPRLKNIDLSITIAAPGSFTTTLPHGLVQDERVTLRTTGSLPTGIAEGIEYFVNVLTPTTFELTDTLGGTSLSLSGTQSGTHKVRNQGPKIKLIPMSREDSSQNVRIWYIRDCARIDTTVSRTLADDTILDIPEFHDFLRAFVKYKILAKEGNPMVEEAAADMSAFQKLMIDSLTNMVPDNDDEIEQDESFYEEHA